MRRVPASFFAWLTGSPFILHEMGYGPTVIGLSYVPQTIAFLIGGYGCRAALQKWQGHQMLPWLLVVFALSVAATWLAGIQDHPSLVDANGSVLHHGDCEWRDLPYRRRPGAETFSTGNRARRRPAEYAAAWPLFPGKPAGLKPYRHSASDHHQRDADFHRSGRHRFLDAATTRAVSERIVSRLMIF